ncbi:MAG: hypothetical protein JNK07_03990 [Alphaproteobacteria bacterium]|nr:hypothetical protein [Alphaproteobacteria bacterium]
MNRFVRIIALATLGATLSPVALAATKIVETKQGIAFTLPDAWTLESFSQENGAARLQHMTLGTILVVARANPEDLEGIAFSEKENLPSGRVLEWRYTNVRNKITYFDGCVRMDDATQLALRATVFKEGLSLTDKNATLAAIRAIANTARTTGPNTCAQGDCGDGTMKDAP